MNRMLASGITALAIAGVPAALRAQAECLHFADTGLSSAVASDIGLYVEAMGRADGARRTLDAIDRRKAVTNPTAFFTSMRLVAVQLSCGSELLAGRRSADTTNLGLALSLTETTLTRLADRINILRERLVAILDHPPATTISAVLADSLAQERIQTDQLWHTLVPAGAMVALILRDEKDNTHLVVPVKERDALLRTIRKSFPQPLPPLASGGSIPVGMARGIQDVLTKWKPMGIK